MKRFTKMAYKNPDEMVFGRAKYPTSQRRNTQIGAGYVVPEIQSGSCGRFRRNKRTNGFRM